MTHALDIRSLATLALAAAFWWSGAASAQCANVQSMYQDLENWVHMAGPGPCKWCHYVVADVTLVNAPTASGTHFYTAWSSGCLMQGVSGFGQCYLTTNPTTGLFFSDRMTATSAAPPAQQPFAIDKIDKHVVALDMVRNEIVSRSLTWNFEKIYKNVSRNKNVIYATSDDGSMIILNLFKASTKTANEPKVCGR